MFAATSSLHWRQPRRAGLIALLAMLHVALLAVLLGHGAKQLPQAPRLTVLRLLTQPQQPSVTPSESKASPRPPRPPTSAFATRPAAQAEVEAPAPTSRSESSATSAAPGTDTGPPPSASPTPPADGRSSLRLSLPKLSAAAPRNPALDDARANTRRRTPDDVIAQALDKEVKVQVLEDGTRRYRQGNKCWDVHTSRVTQLDPMSETWRSAPGSTSGFDCK